RYSLGGGFFARSQPSCHRSGCLRSTAQLREKLAPEASSAGPHHLRRCGVIHPPVLDALGSCLLRRMNCSPELVPFAWSEVEQKSPGGTLERLPWLEDRPFPLQ